MISRYVFLRVTSDQFTNKSNSSVVLFLLTVAALGVKYGRQFLLLVP